MHVHFSDVDTNVTLTTPELSQSLNAKRLVCVVYNYTGLLSYFLGSLKRRTAMIFRPPQLFLARALSPTNRLEVLVLIFKI